MLLLFIILTRSYTKPFFRLKGIGYLTNIVRDTYKEKLPLNLFKPSEVEFAKTYDLLDMTEDGFGNHPAFGVDSLAIERI